jgi:energy-coupling factor transporter ATP-binding protein EcfA2
MTGFLDRLDLGNEAGDDVPLTELFKYFYEQSQFKSFTAPKQPLLVVTAKKGVGKSALLRWVEGQLQQEHENDIIIRCKGADLSRSRFGLTGSGPMLPNDRIREWMTRICTLINRAVAKKIGFAASDDNITLVESAELDGFKQRNIVGVLLDRLGRMLPSNSPEKIRAKEEVELFKRQGGRRVWILIDDLDATFQNTSEELLEMSTCFSALRYLSQEVEGIYFRVTLRTDVWPLIRRYDESLDKLEQYIMDIAWSREDFRGLLAKRVKAQLIDLGVPPPKHTFTESEYINLIMQDTMEWAEKHVPNYQVIYTLSYQRPRWGIQLCKLAQHRATRIGDYIIRKRHIDEVWGEYGTKRIADLVAEHKHQCREIEDLILAFRGISRLLERDQLFDWINRRIIPHVHPKIEGRDVQSPKEVSRFLYRIGFIVARSDSAEGYEHYTFDQMPDLLGTRTDEDFGFAWEIHPCYREALDVKKVDQSHRARFGRLRGDDRH